MSLIDIRRRLDRLQAARSPDAPTRILSDAPLGDVAADMRAADALANWRSWVASGRATVSDGVLYLVGPEMTEAAWSDRFVTII